MTACMCTLLTVGLVAQNPPEAYVRWRIVAEQDMDARIRLLMVVDDVTGSCELHATFIFPKGAIGSTKATCTTLDGYSTTRFVFDHSWGYADVRHQVIRDTLVFNSCYSVQTHRFADVGIGIVPTPCFR